MSNLTSVHVKVIFECKIIETFLYCFSEERFIELLTRVQSHRLDDQRGLTAKDLELPDFLKTEDDEGSDAQSQQSSDTRSLQSADSQSVDTQSVQSVGSVISGASSIPEMAANLDDVHISQMFDAVDVCNLENGLVQDSLVARLKSPGGRSHISYVDQSFGGEGFVPTHMAAENYFSNCQSAHGLEINEQPSNTRANSTNYGQNNIPKAPPRKITLRDRGQSPVVNRVNVKVNQTYVIKPSKSQDGLVDNTLVLAATPNLPSPPVSRASGYSLDDMDMPNYSPPTPLNAEERRKSCDPRLNPPSTLELEDIDAYELITEEHSPSTPSPTTHDLLFSPESPPPSPALRLRPVPQPRRPKAIFNESAINRSLDYNDTDVEIPVQYV